MPYGPGTYNKPGRPKMPSGGPNRRKKKPSGPTAAKKKPVRRRTTR